MARQDAVAMRLMQTQRQFELTASIRDASVAGDVEGRLRDSTHKVSRQRLEPADDAPAGYSQRLVATIQRVQPTDDAEALEAP